MLVQLVLNINLWLFISLSIRSWDHRTQKLKFIEGKKIKLSIDLNTKTVGTKIELVSKESSFSMPYKIKL